VSATTAPPAATPAQIAKGVLRRLAIAKQEPTPENYARAWAEESGQPAPPAADPKALGPAWAALIEKLVRALERGGGPWTPARRKDSLQRVLEGSRSDLGRLQQRLQSLVVAWDAGAADPSEADSHAPAVVEAMPAADWPPLVAELEGTVRAGLPPADAGALADALAAVADRIAAEGPTPSHLAAVADLCAQARRVYSHRHRLVDELGALARELAQGLTALAEDDGWVQGQCRSLEARLSVPTSVRAVRAATALLADTRSRQERVQGERRAARDALKSLIKTMLEEISELGRETDRFHDAVGRHAAAIDGAQTLEGLTGVVRELVQDSRAVQSLVGATRDRLASEHAKASDLEARVRALEAELRRLSDEATTDALTQVANRRGLARAFDTECARIDRAGAGSAPAVSIGLIDIDDFKRLNDSLGHVVGDEALKSLAAAIRERLRPVDHLARFGGEEFVVLLPGTAAAEAQEALTRLQRSLTAALFLHEGREVFVTFSAGVTAWRPGETLDAALERADEALYQAKRSGKNRSCIG
jgi:diguanylate cyclase